MKHFYRKYGNRKVVVDGIKFDSQREAQRYGELELLEKQGIIKDLKLQIPFEIVPKQKDERAVKYIVDFEYYDNELQSMVAEDVKGFKTKDYIIKRKLFKLNYKNYIFKEIL